MRHASSVAALLTAVVFACTGGSGPIDGDGGTASSSGATSSSGSSGGGNQIRASDFDQACSTETDCVAVFEGDVCNACKCQNAAIAKSALAAYQSAGSNEGCPAQQPCAADCAEAKVACAGGKCALQSRIADAGGD